MRTLLTGILVFSLAAAIAAAEVPAKHGFRLTAVAFDPEFPSIADNQGPGAVTRSILQTETNVVQPPPSGGGLCSDLESSFTSNAVCRNLRSPTGTGVQYCQSALNYSQTCAWKAFLYEPLGTGAYIKCETCID